MQQEELHNIYRMNLDGSIVPKTCDKINFYDNRNLLDAVQKRTNAEGRYVYKSDWK